MLQITVNIVQVEVLYLFFFTYLYVLVKIRQLNFKRSFYYFEYSDRTKKTVAFSDTRASYVAIVIFVGDGILLPRLLGYKTEVWLLSTETVTLGIINCST